MDESSSSSSKCEIINEAIPPPRQPPRRIYRRLPPPPPPPPPPPAACLNNEEWKMYILLLKSSSADCEEVRDGEAEEESEIDLIKAAMNDNTKIFDEPKLSLEHISRKSVEKENILHIAVRYKKKEFVAALLSKEKYMGMNKKLINERNSHGNTPLHVAAHVGDKQSVELMYGMMMMKKKKSVEGGHDDDEEEEKPWRAQNSEGNTALHLALLSRNYEVAKFLVERDGGILARMVNNSLEAPLHLAITHLAIPDDCIFMTEVLLEKARCVATWRDAKRFTPLLRAASLLNSFVILKVTNKIIDVCPESTLMCDPLGKSFLHLLILNNKIFHHLHQKNLDKQFNVEYKYIEDLICLNEISILKNHQDQDGHTPLHIALNCDNIHIARYLVSKCSADLNITNKDGISASSMIQQLNLRHQVQETRTTMTEDESRSAIEGKIDFLPDKIIDYLRHDNLVALRDSKGSNFLHLLMNKVAEHPYLSSSHGRNKFFNIIQLALLSHPELFCQTSQEENTPLHNLAQNKDLCKTLADQILEDASLLSKLLSIYAQAINEIESRSATNEFDKHYRLPWVMQNADGNTPLHESLIANNKVLVLELLRYSKESATIVNNHKETPLHLLAATNNGMEEFTVAMVEANSKALELQDKNGRIPMSRAIEVKNLNVVVTLLCYFQDFRNTNDKTLWQNFCVTTDQLKSFLKELFQNEAFRRMIMEQKNKDGSTLLHIAIQEKCFGFVQDLLETRERGSELELSEDNRWPMNLLKKSNNVGETSEDLLADLPTISKKLEEFLLTDRRMRGIRSSWGIPRTQLQNYMSSMNVIAALQTTITFTAAFTVPGGLNQDVGTPILIRRTTFQVFMISDVIAMCLSMMVLICLLWMVATNNKRLSVMIQDFALSLLLASFVATLLTFMTGVYATIYPTKPWIAITTLVLCSLVMLFLPRRVLTNLLLHLNYPKVRCVEIMHLRSADNLNTQEQSSVSHA